MQNAHVRGDFLYGSMRPRMQASFDLVLYVVFFLPGGVTTPPPDDLQPPTLVKPAWISFRPGRAVELLPAVLVKDADPATHRLFALGDEWIVSDAKTGPQRLYGNHLEPLVSKDEVVFAHVVGLDRRGRWLFRKSPVNVSPDSFPGGGRFDFEYFF